MIKHNILLYPSLVGLACVRNTDLPFRTGNRKLKTWPKGHLWIPPSVPPLAPLLLPLEASA